MSNNYNSSAMNVNPILSTLPADQINIQPYWIVVLELVVLQFCQRIWHHFKYKTWFTTLEIAGLIRVFQKHPTDLNSPDQPASITAYQTKTDTTDDMSERKSKLDADKKRLTILRSMIVIDYFDAINCLLILGHAIWYCVIQSTCLTSSSSAATTWNCYNAFGYRLFNYIFVSYSTTALNCVYKAYMQGYTEVIQTNARQGSFCWIIHYASLITIVVTLVFDTCLLLPFILTNVVPMFVIYIWMSIIYIIVCIYLIVSGFLVYEEVEELPEKIHAKEIRNSERSYETQCCSFIFLPKELPKVVISMVLALLITTFPILLSIFYNYTQYFYYGESYLQSIVDDYNARNTNLYFTQLQNSSQQIVHSAVNFV
jgi:hypothetical protein